MKKDFWYLLGMVPYALIGMFSAVLDLTEGTGFHFWRTAVIAWLCRIFSSSVSFYLSNRKLRLKEPARVLLASGTGPRLLNGSRHE